MIIPKDEDAAWAEHEMRMTALRTDCLHKVDAAHRDLDRNMVKQRDWLQDVLHALKMARAIDGE